ncbi:MAG TPA: hypothetical protein DCL38_00695 [Lachnospiraceae bacterium]|nr:hypothetical protein [Lachnospiraceae bacterium]
MALEGFEDRGISELSVIDRNLLQRDQDFFADISGLFLFAIDPDGRQITDISGRDMRDTNRIAELLNEGQIEDIFNRVMKTRLEEQVVENTEYSNLKIAAVAIKAHNNPILCFIVCAVYYEPDGENAVFNIRSIVDESTFFGGIDFLREIYDRIYESTLLVENEKAITERAELSEKAIKDQKKQSEAMSAVVALLDSDESFDDICMEIAGTAGRCAGLSHTLILAPDTEKGTVEVRGKYLAENADPVIERADRAEFLKYAALVGSKPMVVSSRTDIDYDFRLWLGSLGIIGFVSLPVFSARQSGKVSLYIIFADNDPTKIWQREEIRFFGDVTKVLQSIYYRRITKDSLTSSVISLKVILNNVGSYICVKDRQSGEFIFINKRMEEEFEQELKDGTLNRLLASDDDRNDLHTEIEYEKAGRHFDYHRNVIKWVDGRYAVLYSLFDITERKRADRGQALTEKAAAEFAEEASAEPGTDAEKAALLIQEPEKESVREAVKEPEKESVREAVKEPEKESAGEAERAAVKESPKEAYVKDFKDISVEPGVLTEFPLYYQPVIDISKKNKCTGAEALLRWSSKALGFMQAEQFVPNARQSGIIVPIGNHLLKELCSVLKSWNESGHPYFKAYVNIAPEQLLQDNFPFVLSDIITETGVNPRNLVLEFSDVFDMTLLPGLKRALREVKLLGCQVALDDFGTGSFSFNHIKELPLSLVKIGQKFVKNIDSDPYVKSFIRTAGEFLEPLKIKLCVEGIETEEEYLAVSGLKVRNVQGFYFDEPMTREAFENKYLNREEQNEGVNKRF